MRTKQVCLCAKCEAVLAMHTDGVILKGAIFHSGLTASGEPEEKAVLGLDFGTAVEASTQAYCQTCFLEAVGWQGMLYEEEPSEPNRAKDV